MLKSHEKVVNLASVFLKNQVVELIFFFTVIFLKLEVFLLCF